MTKLKLLNRRWLPVPSSAYDQRSAMFFLAPMMLVLFVVAVFPVVYSFWISLHDLKLTRPNRVPFVWFDNYIKLFTDELFWESVARTASFTVSSVLAVMVIATMMAMLLKEEFKGRISDSANSMGNPLCRQWLDVEVDLRLRVRGAEWTFDATWFYRQIHRHVRRYR